MSQQKKASLWMNIYPNAAVSVGATWRTDDCDSLPTASGDEGAKAVIHTRGKTKENESKGIQGVGDSPTGSKKTILEWDTRSFSPGAAAKTGVCECVSV